MTNDPMTTPHAPEGGTVEQAVDDMRVVWSMDIPLFSRRECEDRLSRLIAAARADGATAERTRLAGLASEEDRGMVDALDSICRSGRVTHLEWLEAYTTLLARLAAARGEAVEEAIRWAWANHERFHVDSEDEAVRDALAALFPPPGAEVGRGD